MQADSIQEGVKDLTDKLIKGDSIERHAALNQYFDSSAQMESTYASFRGSTRIKKQFDLFNHGVVGTTFTKKPQYNEQDQTVTFSYQQQYQAPRLPPSIESFPVISRLSGARQAIQYEAKLHLNPDGQISKDGETPTMMVTKMDVERKTKVPLENLIPYTILKPFLSVTANVIASVAQIVTAHPKNITGVIGMTTQGINDLTLWAYGKALEQKEKRFSKAQTWDVGIEGDLPRSFIDPPLSAAVRLTKTLETRARDLGIPIDQVKDKARELVDEVQEQAAPYLDQAQQKAEVMQDEGAQKAQAVKDTSYQKVEEAKDKGYRTVDEAKYKGSGIVNRVEYKAIELEDRVQNKVADGTSEMTTNDSSRNSQESDRPPPSNKSFRSYTASEEFRTPDDETVTPEDAPYSAGVGTGDSDDDIAPRTPLGGHDPLALNAPSFAQIAKSRQ